MSAWPTSVRQPDVGFREEVFKPQIKNEFESGHVQSRGKSTVAKRRWTLPFSRLEIAEYNAIETHFLANQGSVFTWDHPISGTTYNVRYSGDGLTSTVEKRNLRTVIIEIEEAP